MKKKNKGELMRNFVSKHLSDSAKQPDGIIYSPLPETYTITGIKEDMPPCHREPLKLHVSPEKPSDEGYVELEIAKASNGLDKPDPVNHPSHYNSHPAGIECITVIEHFNCNIANAMKYLWRQKLKENSLEDLRKAAWYVNREIERKERFKK